MNNEHLQQQGQSNPQCEPRASARPSRFYTAKRQKPKFYGVKWEPVQLNSQRLKTSRASHGYSYSSGRFTKIYPDCPICGGDNPRKDCGRMGFTVHCRLPIDPIDDLYVPSMRGGVHTLTSSNFYVYVPKRDKNKIFDREQWEKDRQAREATARQQELKTLSPLTPTERDLELRKLLNSLDLAKADREKLKTRGLTDEQIELRMYRSVREHQLVGKDVSLSLPGIALDNNGQKYLSTSIKDGFICPIRDDASGLLTGYQIRDNNPSSKNKYLAPKSKFSWHLNIDGSREWPLAFITPAHLREMSWLVLAEGPGLKAVIAANKWGHYFIGASGGLFTQSPNQLKSYIASYQAIIDKKIADFNATKKGSQKGLEQHFYRDGKLIIRIAVDAGDAVNPKVLQRLEAQIKFLEDLGHCVLILWWGQYSKSANDCDELSQAEMLTAQSIYPSDFFEKAQNKQDIQALEKYTPDKTISIPFVENVLTKFKGIQAIKSGLGTGKTQEIVRYIVANIDYFVNKRIVFLGYRNPLLLQTISKINEGFTKDKITDLFGYDESLLMEVISKVNEALKELGSDITFEMVNQLDEKDINWNPYLALCVDSIGKITPTSELETIIFIDEVDSVAKHTYHAKTHVRIKRVENVERFWELINKAEQVILTDGNLTDRVVDLFKQKCPDKAIYKVLNDFKAERKAPITIQLGTYDYKKGYASTKDIRPTHRKILDTVLAGKIVAVGSDSQKMIETLDYLLKRMPNMQVFDEKLEEVKEPINTFRLDGKTSNKAPQQVFLAEPNTYIKVKELRALLFTTSAESGLDVSIENYFEHAFYIIHGTNGINPINSVAQLIRRIRADIPIDIFIAPSAISYLNMSDTYSLGSFKANKQKDVQENLLNAVFSSCASCGLEETQALEIARKIELQIKQNSSDADEDFCATNQFIAQIQTRNLREYFIDYLQQNSTNPIEFSLPNKDNYFGDGIDGAWTDRRDARNLDDARDVYTAPEPIYESETGKYKAAKDGDWNEKIKASHYNLFPGIHLTKIWKEGIIIPAGETLESTTITPIDIVNIIRNENDTYRLASQLEMEILVADDNLRAATNRIPKKLMAAGKKLDLWNSNDKKFLVAQALSEIGLLEVIKSRQSFEITDPAIKEIITSGRRRYCHLPGKGKSDKVYLKELGLKMGYTLKSGTLKRTDGTEDTVYHFESIILEQLRTTLSELLKAKLERIAKNDLDLPWEMPNVLAEKPKLRNLQDEMAETLTSNDLEVGGKNIQTAKEKPNNPPATVPENPPPIQVQTDNEDVPRENLVTQAPKDDIEAPKIEDCAKQLDRIDYSVRDFRTYGHLEDVVKRFTAEVVKKSLEYLADSNRKLTLQLWLREIASGLKRSSTIALKGIKYKIRDFLDDHRVRLEDLNTKEYLDVEIVLIKEGKLSEQNEQHETVDSKQQDSTNEVEDILTKLDNTNRAATLPLREEIADPWL